jgi:heat shock protein HslJ
LGCSQKTNELVGTNWELVSLNGKDLIEGTTITLEFTETYLGGQMGCNGYGNTPDTGKYYAKSDGAFTLGSPFAVTVQLCVEPEGIMEQEAEYIETLMSAVHYHIVDNRLEIANDSGEMILIFHRK